jgi:prophage tail gpP-like protein
MAFTDVISQPPYPGVNPREVAEIRTIRAGTGGQGIFSDWETVWVRVRLREVPSIFRFTAAERDPVPELWSRLQLQPGDLVEIRLGGVAAITGYILVRQAAYDAHSHAISIQGVSSDWAAWSGGILDATSEFNGSFRDIATKVLKPFGRTPVFEGTISEIEFKKIHPGIGESVFQFLEQLARERDIILGSDSDGNLLFIGKHIGDTVDTLTEGENIKSCQCVISISEQYNPVVTRSQAQRSDEGSPPQAAQMESFASNDILKMYRPLLVANEHPVWTQAEVDLRNTWEVKNIRGAFIEATVVVYGWFTRGGALWTRVVGKKVILNSPMTTLVGYAMGIRSATCTQDRQSGTQTTLDLVAPWLLEDEGIIATSTGKSQLPDAGEKSRSSPNTPAMTGDPTQPPPGGP